jgi:pimeloyl-ACP methyl ester carboxylesterase
VVSAAELINIGGMKLLVVATLVLTALAVPAEATPITPSIVWGPCSDQALAAGGAECGTLDVPLDHANPAGRKITLAVSRVRHKTTVSQGTVLAVPDPLSGTGYGQSVLGARVAGGDSFDWVGFARRGRAPSAPALACLPPDPVTFNRPNYVPTSPVLEAEWGSRVKKFADACAAGQPELLDHMKTTDTVADMELLRAALGTDKVSLFAQAYGTYIGQVYATLHASHVQRMVLDSTVDPRRVWYNASNFDQDPPLERNLELWFDFLAAKDSTYHLGATKAAVQQVWDAQLRKIDDQPADGVIGPPEWIDLFLFTAYTRQTWEFLGAAFSGWVNNGDGATLRFWFNQFYSQGSDNTYGTLLAEICTDTPWPTSWNQWRVDSWITYTKAPNTTWGNTWFNAPCFYWHAKPGQPVQVGSSASTLLVHESLNGATPIEGALEVRSRFPHSALVSVPGGISFSNALTGNVCVDTKIADFLKTGALPARKPGRQADATCAL